MKAYTIPASNRKNRRRARKGVIVKASSKEQAMKKAKQAERGYTPSTMNLAKSKTHISTAEELERSNINGKEPAAFTEYTYVDEI